MFLLEKYLCFLSTYTRVPIPSRSQRETRSPNCLISRRLTIFFSSFGLPHFSALNGFYIVRLYVAFIVIIHHYFDTKTTTKIVTFVPFICFISCPKLPYFVLYLVFLFNFFIIDFSSVYKGFSVFDKTFFTFMFVLFKFN